MGLNEKSADSGVHVQNSKDSADIVAVVDGDSSPINGVSVTVDKNIEKDSYLQFTNVCRAIKISKICKNFQWRLLNGPALTMPVVCLGPS